MRVLLIHNPAAGRPATRRQLPEAIAALQAGGWTVEPAPTSRPGDAARLAEQAARSAFEGVVVAGGDGTVNQVANGLMAARIAGHAAVPMGILPTGTANVLAHELQMPIPGPGSRRVLPEAAAWLLQATTLMMDVGRATTSAGQRHFTCWAGIGLDAAITAEVEQRPQIKRLIGPISFAAGAVKQVGQVFRAPNYTVRLDQAEWSGEGVMIVVSNIKHYALVLDMAPQARLDDGQLDVAFFRRGGLGRLLQTLLLLPAGRHVEQSTVEYARTQWTTIDANSPQPVHLDAEPFGTTPVSIRVIPQALPILVAER